jgi:hypothetical protein
LLAGIAFHVLIIWACIVVAMRKGYHWVIGLILSFFSCAGLIVILLLPNRNPYQY